MCVKYCFLFSYIVYMKIYIILLIHMHTHILYDLPMYAQEALNSFGSSASASQIMEITRIFPLFSSHIFNVLTFLFHCFIYFFAWDVHAVCAPVGSSMLGAEGNTCSIGSLLTPHLRTKLRLSYFTRSATLPVLACFPEELVQLDLSNLCVAMCSQLGGIYSIVLGSESLVRRTDFPGLFRDEHKQAW